MKHIFGNAFKVYAYRLTGYSEEKGFYNVVALSTAVTRTEKSLEASSQPEATLLLLWQILLPFHDISGVGIDIELVNLQWLTGKREAQNLIFVRGYGWSLSYKQQDCHLQF